MVEVVEVLEVVEVVYHLVGAGQQLDHVCVAVLAGPVERRVPGGEVPRPGQRRLNKSVSGN